MQVRRSLGGARFWGLGLLGLGVVFFLLFAIGEIAAGDISGLQHLPPAIVLGALIWLGWRRPRTAGLALLAIAVPLGIAYLVVLVSRELPPFWAVPVALPPIVAGLLLLRAGRSGGDRG